MDGTVNNGIFLTSVGNYGSVLWDCIVSSGYDSPYLQVYICDSCLYKNRKLIELRIPETKTKIEVKEFNPKDPNRRKENG